VGLVDNHHSCMRAHTHTHAYTHTSMYTEKRKENEGERVYVCARVCMCLEGVCVFRRENAPSKRSVLRVHICVRACSDEKTHLAKGLY
jgi:hypothetical protein